MTVKMPEPITAPIPSEVRLSHPRDFFSRISAFSESDSSLSMLLQRKRGYPTLTLRSHPQNRKLDLAGHAFRNACAPQCTLRGLTAQPRELHLTLVRVARSPRQTSLCRVLEKLRKVCPLPRPPPRPRWSQRRSSGASPFARSKD